MLLVKKHRKDLVFSLAELTEWCEEHFNIKYAAARCRVVRVIKKLPVEMLSSSLYRLTFCPSGSLIGGQIVESSSEPKPINKVDPNIGNFVIRYLNEKAVTKFRGGAADFSRIQKRVKEGYTLEDFKIVIDKKIADWKGTSMEKFIRPETLFGNKFESYLNQKETINGKVDQMTNFDFNKYL